MHLVINSIASISCQPKKMIPFPIHWLCNPPKSPKITKQFIEIIAPDCIYEYNQGQSSSHLKIQIPRPHRGATVRGDSEPEQTCPEVQNCIGYEPNIPVHLHERHTSFLQLLCCHVYRRDPQLCQPQ